MKTKNTRELVLRARGHARQDHVEQGTYGEATANGKAEFRGCHIGCLATPHRQPELRAFVKRLGIFGGDEYSLQQDAEDQLKSLQREFGITPALARLGEAVFESLPTHGAAIEFLPAFAAAIPGGVDITPRQARRYADSRGLLFRSLYALSTIQWGHIENPEEERDALLDWLRSKSA